MVCTGFIGWSRADSVPSGDRAWAGKIGPARWPGDAAKKEPRGWGPARPGLSTSRRPLGFGGLGVGASGRRLD
jgi:hypothetical protein